MARVPWCDSPAAPMRAEGRRLPLRRIAMGFRGSLCDAKVLTAKTEQWIMATPSRKPHLHDRRMDDARAEIARAMDRELRLRASERAERVRQLSLETSVERSPDGLRRGP